MTEGGDETVVMTKKEIAEELAFLASMADSSGEEYAFDRSASIVADNIGESSGSGRNATKYTCDGCTPPRVIRAFPSTLAKGPIICGVCDTDFG